MAATRTDQIMAELIGLGYTTGTISDRERKRLLAKTGASNVGKTLQDLYVLAAEPNRLIPDKTIGSGPLGGGGGGGAAIDNVTKSFWLDIDSLAVGDIATDTFKDKTGAVTVTHNHQAVRLTVAQDALANNKKYVEFMADNYFTMPLGSLGIADLWLIVRGTDGPTAWKFGASNAQNHCTYSGAIYDDAFTATRLGPLPSGTVNSKASLYRVKNTVASGKNAWVDNLSIYTGGGSVPSMFPTAFIGCSSADGVTPGAGWIGGRVYEIIALTEANSTIANENIIKTYLNTKYGLALTPTPTLVITDDGNGLLSTTDAIVTDDLAGNLATTSVDVTDSGTGILSVA
jgi:hypothetical protein